MNVLNAADAALLERLAAALGPGGVVPPEPRYLEEPRGRFAGRAAAVLRPDSAPAVAAAVAICAEARVGIVPYSGGTGLVGGQVAVEGPLPVVLSFERMTRVRDLDLVDGVLVAEAGCVLADVQAAALEAGRIFPLTLASEGSARVGGLLGTNAGGVNVLRYGNARDLCLGVEAVMADGAVMHGLGRVVKDNMGYDLRHLLIGSEGTLGLITAASLRLYPVLEETATAWVAVASPEAALALLDALRRRLGGTISAFELMSVQGLGFLAETLPSVPQPPAMASGWRVLVESADAAGAETGARLEAALAAALEAGVAEDVLVAQSEAQRAVFWGVRETIPEANRLVGAISSHDISLPPARLGRVRGPGRADGGGAGPGAPGQLLRAPRGREPALQRLSAGGAEPEALRNLARAGEAGGARPRARARRLGRGGARGGAAEGRRPPALRRPGEGRGDARDQEGLGSLGDSEPWRRAGLRVDCAPSLWGGGREGALYPDWRV